MISEEGIFQVHCETGNISVVKEMVMSGIWEFKYLLHCQSYYCDGNHIRYEL
jgi:hypothetical protein